VRRRYLELASSLRRSIQKGDFAVGTQMPTETELCEQFHVSRSTVRQALGVLEESGLIARRQGSGTTVIAADPPVRYVLSVETEADILRYASEAVFTVKGTVRAASYVDARRLALGDPSQWTCMIGIRREGGTALPIALTTVYLPLRYSDVAKQIRGRVPSAIFIQVARKYGLTLSRIEHEITATVLSNDEADSLQAAEGSPALIVVRRFISGEEGLIEVSESIHPADRFTYAFRINRESSVID
jgi:GntR family transcriptional regulator